jgi:hypothetical protein
LIKVGAIFGRPRRHPLITRHFSLIMTLTSKLQHLTALRPLSPESVASLEAAWDVRMGTTSDHFTEVSKMIALGKGGERSSVDCGSLLPLSAKQPAASGSALARRSRTKSQSSAVDSRLSHGKLQQAVAVQSLRRSTMPDQFPDLRKLIPQFTFSTSHFSLATSHS